MSSPSEARPPETSVPSHDRLKVVQQVPCTSTSLNDTLAAPPSHSTASTSPKRPRRLPQPIETTTRSHMRGKSDKDGSSPAMPPKKKFIVEPYETNTRSSRQTTSGESRKGGPSQLIVPRLVEPGREDESARSSARNSGTSTPIFDPGFIHTASHVPGTESRKRFVPQLIESGKRSFRQPTYTKSRPEASTSGGLPPSAEESPFSYANLVRRKENRRHAFRAPELPDIQSSSSEESAKSPEQRSLSTSPSALSDEGRGPRRNEAAHATLKRQPAKSYDEQFSDYLLSLAARTAEQELQDQALAAFPNEQVHQPVSHFAIDPEEDGSEDEDDDEAGIPLRDFRMDISTWRRGSTADLGWELEEMRRHKEESEMRARERKLLELSQSRFSAAAIAARQMNFEHTEFPAAQFLSGLTNKNGVRPRISVSPPMLGTDIAIPRSLSPLSTMDDVDQRGVRRSGRRNKNSDRGKRNGYLWTPNIDIHPVPEGGLWNGTCKRKATGDMDQLPPSQIISALPSPTTKWAPLGLVTPLLTPSVEIDSFNFLKPAAEPAVMKVATRKGLQASSPRRLFATEPDSDAFLDRNSTVEKEIDREFHDAFVTQIYNYLSLGYPSIARDYDAELSKITRITIHEIRKDDHTVNAKGYIGAPEGDGMDEADASNGKCMRWVALRLYIREWARQQPRMAKQESIMDAWGVRARRGSWAI